LCYAPIKATPLLNTLCQRIIRRYTLLNNDDILIFASYFHDVSAFPPYRPDGAFDHALESSKVVPDIARGFGYAEDEIEIIVETVKFHDKLNMGEYIETRLMRNADGVDYLGYMAVARDFSKQPQDMQKAIAMLRKRKEQFYSVIDFEYAKELAAPRLVELENFIGRFEDESFGLY
jgi:hypothetical protein